MTVLVPTSMVDAIFNGIAQIFTVVDATYVLEGTTIGDFMAGAILVGGIIDLISWLRWTPGDEETT